MITDHGNAERQTSGNYGVSVNGVHSRSLDKYKSLQRYPVSAASSSRWLPAFMILSKSTIVIARSRPIGRDRGNLNDTLAGGTLQLCCDYLPHTLSLLILCQFLPHHHLWCIMFILNSYSDSIVRSTGLLTYALLYKIQWKIPGSPKLSKRSHFAVKTRDTMR